MNYKEAINRLEFHSQILIENETDISNELKESLDYALYVIQYKKEQINLSNYLNDIIKCLTVINLHLNGQDPNNRSFADKEIAIDRQIVISIQRIIYNLQKADKELKNQKEKKYGFELYKLQFVISECWLNILEGGDIEDIRKEIVEPALMILNELNQL